jgi:hypothetical protein
MRGRTISTTNRSTGERSSSTFGVCHVGLVVWTVEVDAVPASRIQDVRSNTSWTCGRWKALGIKLSVSARCCVVASVVWRIVAAEACLHLHVPAGASSRVTNKHTEALRELSTISYDVELVYVLA